MIEITIDLPESVDLIGVKETLKDYLERFGDVRVVNVEIIEEQMNFKESKSWMN